MGDEKEEIEGGKRCQGREEGKRKRQGLKIKEE